MITVLLRNRLGNILFQYAVGRHLQIRNGGGLRLDAFSYAHMGDPQAGSLRRLLAGFDLKADIHIPSRKRLPTFMLPYRFKKTLKERYLRRAYGASRLYVERESGFDPRVLDLPDGAVLYVFSDDIRWCRKHLRIPGCVYPSLGLRPLDTLDDMRLMSLCRHHITANSTFSWWPAWLGSVPDKIVTAPAQWFTDERKNARALADLIPREWQTILV